MRMKNYKIKTPQNSLTTSSNEPSNSPSIISSMTTNPSPEPVNSTSSTKTTSFKKYKSPHERSQFFKTSVAINETSTTKRSSPKNYKPSHERSNPFDNSSATSPNLPLNKLSTKPNKPLPSNKPTPNKPLPSNKPTPNIEASLNLLQRLEKQIKISEQTLQKVKSERTTSLKQKYKSSTNSSTVSTNGHPLSSSSPKYKNPYQNPLSPLFELTSLSCYNSNSNYNLEKSSSISLHKNTVPVINRLTRPPLSPSNFSNKSSNYSDRTRDTCDNAFEMGVKEGHEMAKQELQEQEDIAYDKGHKDGYQNYRNRVLDVI